MDNLFNDWKNIGKELVKDKNISIRNYCYYMLNRTQSMFKYNNLPDTIPQHMLELMLQTKGVVAIGLYEDKLYAFQGGYGGYPDAYYRATKFIVANPYLKFDKDFDVYYTTTDLEEVKDKNNWCVVIYNDELQQGLMPIYIKYASLLTENDITLRLADINLRLTTLIAAGDDRTKNTALEYLRQIENGNLGVLSSKSFTESLQVIPSTNASFSNYLSQLIEYEQYLKANWFNDLGINANFNMKREALNSNETGMNDLALLPLVDNMLYEREHGLEKVNKLFGTNITVEFNSAWKLHQDEIKLEQEEPEQEQEDDNDEAKDKEDIQDI